MTRIDQIGATRERCDGACGGGCEPKATGVGLTIAGGAGEEAQVDILTRGLLGSFARFIATGEEEDVAETTEAAEAPQPHDPALDEALGRVERAMTALVSAMPNLEERLAGVEARVDGALDLGEGVDRDAVATGLKDRLAHIERECQRLASVPIERIETRVAAAERSLGSLVERAEAAVDECARQRDAAERAAERLSSLAGALSPWVELLDLRESEDGLPKPMSSLLRVAGAELAREMACVRGSLDRFAGVLELPEAERGWPEIGVGRSVEGTPGEGVVVAPQEPSEENPRRDDRGKNGKAKAVRAKGSDAEAPRRGASDKRLTAAARLRARSRAEGRPPRR